MTNLEKPLGKCSLLARQLHTLLYRNFLYFIHNKTRLFLPIILIFFLFFLIFFFNNTENYVTEGMFVLKNKFKISNCTKRKQLYF